MIFFKEYNVAPNPKECKYWIDLTEDPHGGIIKFYNGKSWISLNNTTDTDVEIDEIKQDIQDVQNNLKEVDSDIDSINQQISTLNNNKASKDVATTSVNGLMSSADKSKLDGIQANAKNTTVENVLTSDNTANALSAAQGKALKTLIDQLTSRVEQLESPAA